jgi:hypothetical protein
MMHRLPDSESDSELLSRAPNPARGRRWAAGCCRGPGPAGAMSPEGRRDPGPGGRVRLGQSRQRRFKLGLETFQVTVTVTTDSGGLSFSTSIRYLPMTRIPSPQNQSLSGGGSRIEKC